MTGFKFLGAALVLSALHATPASAQASEPALAAAMDPNFSIYSDYGRGSPSTMASEAPLGGAPRLQMSVRPHRANHTAGAKRY